MDTSSQPVAAASDGCRSAVGAIARRRTPGPRPGERACGLQRTCRIARRASVSGSGGTCRSLGRSVGPGAGARVWSVRGWWIFRSSCGSCGTPSRLPRSCTLGGRGAPAHVAVTVVAVSGSWSVSSGLCWSSGPRAHGAAIAIYYEMGTVPGLAGAKEIGAAMALGEAEVRSQKPSTAFTRSWKTGRSQAPTSSRSGSIRRSAGSPARSSRVGA